THDVNGNVLTETDARGVTVTFTYDGLNRVKTRRCSGSACRNDDVDFEYDMPRAGTTCENPIGRLTFSKRGPYEWSAGGYDAMGRLTEETHNTAGALATAGYTYDKAGNLASTRYPSGEVVSNSFNLANQVT